MLAACALLAVVDAPVLAYRGVTWLRVWGALLGLWATVSMLMVPEVVDHGLTMGLVASLICVVLMWAVGRRVAIIDSGWAAWAVGAVVFAAVVSALLGLLQYLDLAQSLSPWVNQPFKGDAFANLRQRNQFASLTSIGLVAVLGWYAIWASQRSQAEQLSVWLVLQVLAAGVACSVSRTGAVQLVVQLWCSCGAVMVQSAAVFGNCTIM